MQNQHGGLQRKGKEIRTGYQQNTHWLIKKLGKIYTTTRECTMRTQPPKLKLQLGKQIELYQITRDLSGKFQGECDVAKDKDMKRITIKDKQLQRKAEHCREVLDGPDPAERACIAQPLGDKLDIDCSPPPKIEILKVIQSLNNNKALGIKNITAEVHNSDIDWLYNLFHKIGNAETIPENWYRGLIVKLHKKGERTQMHKLMGSNMPLGTK